jgi:hypothetical protein
MVLRKIFGDTDSNWNLENCIANELRNSLLPNNVMSRGPASGYWLGDRGLI